MSEYPIDWSDDTVRQYLTAEAHQKSKEEFERTHIDIDKLRADYLFPHSTNDEFVTQEEFRDAILKSNTKDDNRIFILRGETGSGKSQLCQWLEYQIGQDADSGVDDTHVALHVSRSQTRIKDIVEILTEPLEMDVNVRDVGGLDPEKVANAMIANLEAYNPMLESFTEEEIQSLVEDRPQSTDLRGILEKNVRKYQEAVLSDDEEDIPELITEKDYRDLSMVAFGMAKGGDTIFPALQSFIDQELSSKLGVGDFQQRLKEISEEYVAQGLRPVLICEDLTTFSVLKEQLLDHIFQLDSGHYDVVLGWTTGWEKDNVDKALGTNEDAQTYMKDRAEGYLSTTDDTGQAYFLTDDVTVELARKYLSVIREDSSTSADVEIPDGDFDGLYPFNAEFVKRAYENLVQDGNERRTPRLLLMRIVRECLTSTRPPFEAIDGNPYVKQFPTPVSLDYPAEVQSIVKWYGIPTAEGNMRVPRSVFELFDVPVPERTVRTTESDVVFDADTGPAPDLRLRQIDGQIEPGATITVEALLSDRPESDVEVTIDGTIVGYSDDDGRLSVTLPDEEGEVVLGGEKADLTGTLDFAVGTDSLALIPTPSTPNEGETVRLTARVNGEPTPGVSVERDGEVLGTTGEDGTFELPADDPPSMTIAAEYENLEDEIEVRIAGARTYPVEIDYDSETVDEYLFDYQQWVSNGEEYSSSTTLRDGAAELLEGWYDPTRLANPNSSTRGIEGIYYTRGNQVPVSLQGVDERTGISVELPFGSEYDQIYEPLFWYGVSADGELPREDRYDLNYGLLRNWADDSVAEFKRGMRERIEDCFEGWTIEEFVVVAQYLLINAAQGKTELTRDLVFESYDLSTNDYPHPFKKRFKRTHPFFEAFSNLTTKSSVPADLAEGFFKIKENFVDSERLNEAYGAVANDLETYLEEAMFIDTNNLPDAYKVGTTRKKATIKLASVLECVKVFSQEVNGLGPSDIEYITKTVEEIDEWYDKSHSLHELRELYDELLEIIGDLDVNMRTRWEERRERLDDEAQFQLGAFAKDIERFREIESAGGHELVGLMHEFEKSREKAEEWKIYEAIGEMIETARVVDIPEIDNELESAVRDSEEFHDLVGTRNEIADVIGGE
ncbi:immunoglobulin domain-containing family protein [Natronorubrum aibiense]|uniref:S-layer protein n=1 Tax=Natronorubrum aibiense TaxID=348826 RepID=A0A5P9P811_9EURY|nr:S-layer protein [Natronorubrum aibiense]QFU84272.1 S-layer protein [Natronorubrum aibiense]